MTRPLLLALVFALSACSGEAGGLPGGESTQPFGGIDVGERLHFVGTEPFWAGDVAGGTLTYSTPENSDGTAIEVERFAGRGGVSWSGMFDDAPFLLAASEAPCSDGMSDRRYPFTVTVQVRSEMRSGCGWTRARPFDGPPAP